jgi:glycosyltransferase involved in cell wall biosynthesis
VDAVRLWVQIMVHSDESWLELLMTPSHWGVLGNLTEIADKNRLKLLVLCAGDPNSEIPFSGSSRSLIQALERRGVVAHKANVLGFSDPFTTRNKSTRFFRNFERLGILANYRHSSICLGRNSRRAMDIIDQASGFNACLMYGTRFHPRLRVPMYCYFDATVAQVVKAGGWTYGLRSPSENAVSFEYQKEVFASCTGIFPRSQYAANSVINDYGVPPAKITVAGAGCNHNEEPLLHENYGNKNILFIGVQFERKGGALILDAFRILRKLMPDATLTIIGCNPNINEPGVEVVGRIYKDSDHGSRKILEYYSKASIFCIMSIFEPFGIVVIEAQNSYVPCIVPNRFAFTEIVKNGLTGIRLVEETPKALSKVMFDLLGDPLRLKAMGEAANRFIQGQWTWDKAAERIEQRITRDLNESRH